MIAITAQSFLKNEFLMNTLLDLVDEQSLILAPKGPILEGDSLYQLLKPASAVLCGRELLDKDLLQRLPNLKFISKYGVGLDNIDLTYITQSSIELHFKPGVNASYVAEQSLGFMISASRNLVQSMEKMRTGVWFKNGGRSIFNKTVGIVGCGHVGRELVRLLKPFSCRILFCDILDMEDYAKKEGVEQVELDFLIQNADIVSLHVPLTEETRYMISSDQFKMMKESSILINTCRGSVVHEDDLFRALSTGQIAYSCSDVFELEPLTKESLYKLENFWPTSHIAGNAKEAIIDMGLAAIDGIAAYLKGIEK